MKDETIFILLDTITFFLAIAYICYNHKKNIFLVAAKFLAGFVLISSSLFHIYYGEQRIRNVEKYSWDWWTDTYECTVMATVLVLWMVITWVLKPFNLKAWFVFLLCAGTWGNLLWGGPDVVGIISMAIAGCLTLWYSCSAESILFIVNYMYFLFGIVWLSWVDVQAEEIFNWTGVGLGIIWCFFVSTPKPVPALPTSQT